MVKTRAPEGQAVFTLRVPEDLYPRLRALAAERERSVNWVVVRILRRAAVERDDWIAETLDRPALLTRTG